jgi:hypothetical protein
MVSACCGDLRPLHVDTAFADLMAMFPSPTDLRGCRIHCMLRRLLPLLKKRRYVDKKQVFLCAHHLVWSSGEFVLHTMCTRY